MRRVASWHRSCLCHRQAIPIIREGFKAANKENMGGLDHSGRQKENKPAVSDLQESGRDIGQAQEGCGEIIPCIQCFCCVGCGVILKLSNG